MIDTLPSGDSPDFCPRVGIQNDGKRREATRRRATEAGAQLEQQKQRNIPCTAHHKVGEGTAGRIARGKAATV